MMMKIAIDFSKTAQQNALHYFDQAKKLKQKIKGAEEGMQKVQSKLAELAKKDHSLPQKKSPQLLRKKEWFEKFHWCYTRHGLLVVGGRDAHSNEALVKKHLEDRDWYFHADIHGAPHCVLKEGKARAKKEDMEDAAAFAALFASGWKKGLFSVRVYSVSNEQVSKKAPAGESLGKGAFMIYGERKWFDPSMKMGIGVQKAGEANRIMSGPYEAIRKHCSIIAEIIPGEKTKTEVAKSYLKWLQKKLPHAQELTLDEITAALPNGSLALHVASA
ncbi:MAG: DUF814 domain-containing protein [Candidatus Iainarchaeum archaeon]|uniref:DUF814 domain-containing protein n=1 Tax=Candidatus Iainarchaeum sp. TaxID=3101447 RepID=A0A7T9DJT4_9ARCH|nr:MAG: DUF814 domain-containing protein [Candidatus Diapherotrites archaeon]